jgi:hypothetical protein
MIVGRSRSSFIFVCEHTGLNSGRTKVRENGTLSYAAKGKVDFFGEQAMMVPGAQFAPRVPQSLAYSSLPDG